MNLSVPQFTSKKLQQELTHYPHNDRFFTGDGSRRQDYFCANACVIGFGMDADAAPLDDIPPQTKGLYLYYGAGIKSLLAEILHTPVAANLEYLTIGITHHHSDDYADYSAISKLLSNVHLPKLKRLEYGIDEPIANTPCIYGNLGDITSALKNMPNLEELFLYGNFSLTEPIDLPQLITLETLQNDIGTNINGGKISNHTLQHLLTSKFESLRLLSVNLLFNDNLHEYSLPEAFLKGESTPGLKSLELCGKFVAGTTLQISRSPFFSRFVRLNIQIDNLQAP